jgi:hypothetical protein
MAYASAFSFYSATAQMSVTVANQLSRGGVQVTIRKKFFWRENHLTITR